MLVNVELPDLTLLFGQLVDFSLDIFLLLLQDDVFVAHVGLGRLFQGHHLLLVLCFLLFQLLDVLVSFLHLVFAVLDFLLQLIVVRFERLVIFGTLLEGFLSAF